MAEIRSKIVISAEDRTRAAFDAIERNAGKTEDAFRRLTGTALKLAGAGTLIAFFRGNAESTEKWRDEMAKLDETTKKFFNTVARSGDLDPLITGIKAAYSAATGASIALIKLGQGMAAFARDVKLLFTDFNQSGRELAKWKRSVDEADKRFQEFNKNLFTDAPRGYAKSVEEAAARTKEAARQMKEAEEKRREATLAAGKAAEDAFRAEAELSEGYTAAGLSLLGEKSFNERLEKERELLQRESDQRAEQREQDIQALLESQLTEKELIDAKHADDLQTLYDARQAEYLTEAQFKEAREKLELDHRARLGDVMAKAEQRAIDITKLSYQKQTQAVLSELVTMTAGVSRHNKFLFQVNKAAALANTALKVPEAVASSFAFGARIGGPVLGAIFGGIALAAQMAQLRAIAATSFEGASGAAGVPSLAGTPGTPVTEVPVTEVPVNPNEDRLAQQQRAVNIYLSGEGSPTQSYIRDVLVPGLQEAIGDGVTFNVRAVGGLL